MLASASLDFFYTLVIIFVFYELPKRYYGQYTLRKGSMLNIAENMRMTQLIEEQ